MTEPDVPIGEYRDACWWSVVQANLPDLMPSIHKMFVEWCRLKGHKPPKAGIELMVDEATGYEAKLMAEFCENFKDLVIQRLPTPPEAR